LVKALRGLAEDIGNSISYDKENKNIYISGNYCQKISIDDKTIPYELESLSSYGNAFIAKYNIAGDIIALYNLPGNSETTCENLIIDNNKIFIAGKFYDSINLLINNDLLQLGSIGGKDIFIMSYIDICNDYNIDAGPNIEFCQNQTYILQIEENLESYQWVPGGEINQDYLINTPGTYFLHVYHYGCFASDSIIITPKNIPTIFVGHDTIIEATEFFILNSVQGDNFESCYWNTLGDGYFDNPYSLNVNYYMSINEIQQGEFNLFLTTENQCGSSTDSINISLATPEDGILVYPNPSNGLFSLICDDGITIEIASVYMQSGYIIEADIAVNQTMFTYDISNYPPGTYLVNVVTNLGSITKIINKL
jgi:hypothetical protein